MHTKPIRLAVLRIHFSKKLNRKVLGLRCARVVFPGDAVLVIALQPLQGVVQPRLASQSACITSSASTSSCGVSGSSSR
jgi:hypothetical protein